jgi:hypothetical protein
LFVLGWFEGFRVQGPSASEETRERDRKMERYREREGMASGI